MENIQTTETDYFSDVLRVAHEGERIYFSSKNNEEYVLITRKELELMEKQIAFNKLIHELNEIQERNDRNNTWLSEEEAHHILGWDEE